MLDKPASTKPVVICSWCPDATLKTFEANAAGLKVTHTICSACQAKFFPETMEPQ